MIHTTLGLLSKKLPPTRAISPSKLKPRDARRMPKKLLHPERHHLRKQIETPYPRNTKTQSIFPRYGKDRPSLERQNEKRDDDRKEREDIEIQI